MARINIVDVGAVGGLDIPWRDHPHRVGTVLSFEPNSQQRTDGTRIIYNTALGGANGRAKFFVSGPSGQGSSLLEQNVAWVEAHFAEIRGRGNRALNETWAKRSKITEVREVEVRTLDHVLGDLGGRPRFPFLKSDTQGGEMPILCGGEGYLREECVGLELELFRLPLYQGVVLEDDVIAHLAERGFAIAGWTGYHNSFDASSDYLFVRRPRTSAERQVIDAIMAVYRPQGAQQLIKQRARGLARWTGRARRLAAMALDRIGR